MMGGAKKKHKECNRTPYVFLADREKLVTSQTIKYASLNAFPFCLPQGPLQAHCAKSGTPTSFVSTPSSASKLAPKV